MSRSILVSMLASLILAVGLVGTAEAGDNPYPPGAVTVWTPDDWTTKAAGDEKGAMLVSVNADQSAGVFVTVTDAKDVKKAQKLLKKLLKPVLTKPKLGKAKVIELNGMKGVVIDGKAKTKDAGKKVGIRVILVETPAKKALLFVGLADEEKFAANKDTLVKIIDGIKPLAQ